MNGQNRVAATGGASIQAGLPTLVDHLLRTALDFRVAALHRVKVQRCGVGAGRHRAGRAAAHANAHAGAAELDQQAAGGEEDFVGQIAVNHAQTAGDHDGLVVATLGGINVADNGLFVLAEVAQQVRATKFVVERRAAQRAFDHDLQRAGDVFWFAVTLLNPFALSLSKGFDRLSPNGGFIKMHLRHGKTGQSRFGFGATPGRALVPNLAAGTRCRTRKRGDRRWVVVGFHLHQDVL